MLGRGGTERNIRAISVARWMVKSVGVCRAAGPRISWRDWRKMVTLSWLLGNLGIIDHCATAQYPVFH